MYKKELDYLDSRMNDLLKAKNLLKTARPHINQISFILDEAEPYSVSLNIFASVIGICVNVDGWTETDVLDKIIHPISDALETTSSSSDIDRGAVYPYSTELEYRKTFWVNRNYTIILTCTVLNSPDCGVVEYKEEVTRYKLTCGE